MTADPATPPIAIDRLGPLDVPEVIRFLDEDPVVNVYLLALVLRDALARPRDEWWAARRAGHMTALVHMGAGSGAVLPFGDDDEALRALGRMAAGRLDLLPARFQVIGPALAVDHLRACFPGPTPPPRLERRQLYLALAADLRHAIAPLPELRQARREDYAMLYESGAALRAEELLEDPRDVDAIAYARRVEEDCRDGFTYVWRDARGLVFRASVSALTADAAQVSGVWTAPEHRGHGIATRALAELCSRLLARSREVCLFVNDFNAPALAVYRRIGFRERLAWASAFFDRRRPPLPISRA